jgi:serine/threonine-protein kinase PknG
MTTCTRTDCDAFPDGVVDADGFCESCFRGPLESGAERDGGGNRERCVRSDCPGGLLGDDGFCETCFREPAAGAAPTVQPTIWHRVAWESSQPTKTKSGQPVKPARPAAAAAAAGGPVAWVFPTGARARAAQTGARLGLDVVDIPPVPSRDPREALLDEAALQDQGRRCANPDCRASLELVAAPTDPVTGDLGPLVLPERCQDCDTPVSWRLPLESGETVGQYEIQGCIGRGGQGLVYLAHDLNLDGDPVAVKGLRDSANHRALAAERRTLIKVRHPDIVDIRNFVQRRDPFSGRLDGYIVMELLDGESLADKARAAGGTLPVAKALAYVLGTLPALGYLHTSGLVYGDYKPPNVMQIGDRVKLVDLGAVSPIGRLSDGQIWATRGFTAPEVLRHGASTAASDIYSVGRTLAALTMRFPMVDDRGAELPIPDPGGQPALARHESFYRLLVRATAPDPAQRFSSAAQLAGQMAGVLREVAALEDGGPHPAPSALFTPERGFLGAGTADRIDAARAVLTLPLPRPDERDPAAGFLETVGALRPREAAARLAQAPRKTPEVLLRLALTRIELGDLDGAGSALDDAAAAAPGDWRLLWYRGLLDLARDHGEAAWPSFATLRNALPGEQAPKLALAVCAETRKAYELAQHYYRTVWRTDDTFVGAAFGVARCYVADSKRPADDQPIKVLERIPAHLYAHREARIEALRLRLARPDLDLDGLREAVRRLGGLGLDGEQRLTLEVEAWLAARDWLARQPRDAPVQTLSDLSPDPVELRGDTIGRELERAYLGLRDMTPSRRKRADYVHRAHQARPRTRW